MGLLPLVIAATLLPAAFVLVSYLVSFTRPIEDGEIKARRRWKMMSRGNALWLATVLLGLILIAKIMPPSAPVAAVGVSWAFILLSFAPYMLVLGIVDKRIRGIEFPLSGYVGFQYAFFFSRWSSFLIVVALLYCPLSFVNEDGRLWYGGIALAACGAALFVAVTLYQMRLVGRVTGMLTALGSDQEPARMIRRLADRAGIAGARVFVMETFGYPFYNAFAATGRTIYVTRPLLLALDEEELAAVAAHEIGHLATMKKRTLLILALLTACVVAVWFLVPRIPGILSDIGSFIVQIAAVLAILLVAIFSLGAVSRRFEDQADKTAAELMGETEKVISALEKIYTLNMIPRRFDKKGSENASHPSLERRVAQLKGEELPKPKRNLKRTVIVWLCLVVLMVLILLLYPWRRPDVPVGEGYQYSWVDVITALEETVAVEPDNFEALKRLAVEYYLIGEDDLALEKTDRALALKKDPGLLVMRGLLLEFRGDRNGSLEAMEDASREGGSTLPLKWGAILAAEAGDAKKARRFMADIVKISPDDPFTGEMEKRLAGGTAPIPFVGYGFAFQRGGTTLTFDAAPISPNYSKEE